VAVSALYRSLFRTPLRSQQTMAGFLEYLWSRWQNFTQLTPSGLSTVQEDESGYLSWINKLQIAFQNSRLRFAFKHCQQYILKWIEIAKPLKGRLERVWGGGKEEVSPNFVSALAAWVNQQDGIFDLPSRRCFCTGQGERRARTAVLEFGIHQCHYGKSISLRGKGSISERLSCLCDNHGAGRILSVQAAIPTAN
jgi:hypothetical protein